MNKPKILIDLKPALDGYAGIPQESRLLFLNLLKQSDDLEVDGLLQHGGNFLTSPLKKIGPHTAPHEQIIEKSNTIISLSQNENPRLRQRLSHTYNYISKVLSLKIQAMNGRKEPLGYFEPGLFDDFLWRALFSKTLKPQDKPAVCSANYRILRQPRGLMYAVGRKGITRFNKPHFLTLDTAGYDFFIAQSPFPGRVSEGTQLVIRYHDSVPIFMPHTIENCWTHQAAHYNALRDNVKSGALFLCISETTRDELIHLFPELESRSSVIHNAISDDYFIKDSNKHQIQHIFAARTYADKDLPTPPKASLTEKPVHYLLSVSTLEPRKNHELLVTAWEHLKLSSHSDLKLVLVGSPGWNYESILERLKPWVSGGDIFYLTDVPAHELRKLYTHADATICPSLAEGFDYSGIEAMRCGCPVVASDIPIHKEIYGNAAEYFDPYDSEETSQKILQCIDTENTSLRERLRIEAKKIVARYNRDTLTPQWHDFFNQIPKADKQ